MFDNISSERGNGDERSKSRHIWYAGSTQAWGATNSLSPRAGMSLFKTRGCTDSSRQEHHIKYSCFVFVCCIPPVLLRLVISSNTDFKARTSKILSDQGSSMWTMEPLWRLFFLRFPSRNDAKKCLHILAYWLCGCCGGDGGEIKPRW